MQNPKRRSAPVLKTYPLKTYPLKEYAPKHVRNGHIRNGHTLNGHKPVQALLCAALLLPGLLSLPAFASAQEAAQEPVQETVQEEAKQAVPGPAQSRTATEAKPLPDTAGTARSAESSQTAESASSSSSAGSDKSAATGLHLPSLTDFAPGSVYSGTLGELVRLQAGQEMARAALSLKEIQARILEVENSMAKARRELSEAKAREEADRAQNGTGGKASLQEALNELKSGFASLAEDVAALRLEKAQGNDRQCLVLSVRSQGSRLVAELATKDGRFLAGAGDRVPGVGRIDTVSRSKVTAEGRSLPWK